MNVDSRPFDGKIVTNTLAGINMQTAVMFGLPMVYKEKSTLNEHLRIQAQNKPDPLIKPEARFLVVGNGGHEVSDVNDGLITPMPIRHEPTDVAPYNIIPLVLRPVDNDLGDVEREKYALRVKVEIKGRFYWAYYAKRLDHRGIACIDYYTRVRDSIESVTEFEYSDINLFPKPPKMPNYNLEVTDQVVPDDGDYVHSSAKIMIPMDATDVAEMVNVANIMYGDPRKAVVSEFCLCHGVDSMVEAESAVGSPFQFKEVIGCQVNIFLTTFANVSFNNKGLAYDIECGQVEPMPLSPDQIPVSEEPSAFSFAR